MNTDKHSLIAFVAVLIAIVLMTAIGAALSEKPPEIAAGSTVLLEDGFDPAIGEPMPTFRPYYVMLDAHRQEIGDRTNLKPAVEAFTELGYAEAWCAWVQAQAVAPMPNCSSQAI